jgi:hypothetical protein
LPHSSQSGNKGKKTIELLLPTLQGIFGSWRPIDDIRLLLLLLLLLLLHPNVSIYTTYSIPTVHHHVGSLPTHTRGSLGPSSLLDRPVVLLQLQGAVVIDPMSPSSSGKV